jgi:uncharacterized DUF497 family protein
MDEPILVWDLANDPDGNVAHIAEHGVTTDEVESVLRNPANPTATSDSSDRPITFGWTDTGRYIAVVWEPVMDDPRTIYPVTAYEAPPPAARRKRKKR